MSEQKIIEIRLNDEQRIAVAAILRAARRPGYKHEAAILTVVTDSYVPVDKSSVLRLQVAVVEWKAAEKIAKLIAENALPVEEFSSHFN